MFQVLDGSEGNVLGVEISQGYTNQDIEQFKKAFEDVIANGNERVNLLCKIDELKISESQFKAFVEDARYALKNIDQLRHIAVVGDSKIEAAMVKVDNWIFGNKEKDRIEKYFNVADIGQAWTFVKS